MTRTPPLGTAAAAVLAVSLVLVGVVPGDEQYSTWTGSDPLPSTCADPGDTRAAVFVARTADTVLSMRYSGLCRTVWAVLDGAPAGTRARVERSDGRTQSCTADAAGTCTTRQLDDADVKSCAYATLPEIDLKTDCY